MAASVTLREWLLVLLWIVSAHSLDPVAWYVTLSLYCCIHCVPYLYQSFAVKGRDISRSFLSFLTYLSTQRL